MTNLGELLKAEREKRGLSLHEIGMSLKINPKILKAIEDGDQQNLPAKTFLRGFVKSYAHYLRLDHDAVLQMFQTEYGNTRPEEPLKLQPAATTTPHATPDHPTHAPKYENSLKRPDDSALPVASNNRIYTILVAILLLTLIAFVAKMMDKYQKESEISKVPVIDSPVPTTTLLGGETAALSGDASVAGAVSGEAAGTSTTTTTLAAMAVGSSTTTTVPSTTLTTTTTTSTTTTTLRPTTTTTLRLTTTTTTTTTTTLRTTTTTLRPTTTTTTMRPTTTTTTTTMRPTTTTTLRAVVPMTTTSTTLASGATTTTAVKGVNTEVIIEAQNRVTIRFTLSGGQKWESLELNPDQVHTFRSRAGVQLEISDGGAVNVIVNGRDRGVPGPIGKPLKVTYP